MAILFYALLTHQTFSNQSMTIVTSLVSTLKAYTLKQVFACVEYGDNAGPGVYEVALRYGDALLLADSGQLFKTSVKQLGQLRHGVNGKFPIYPSFMAKPSASLPGIFKKYLF